MEAFMLQMTGVDYEKADLDIRSLFSFQTRAAREAALYIKQMYGVDGVVVLFTCNRTEVYVSTTDKIDLFEAICRIKNIDTEKYIKYAVKRCGNDAVDHLFRLACGMESKVFGEDQIITQVKDALIIAREIKATDSYIERTFQTVLAAAKKVKTKTRLTAVNTSVVDELIKTLQSDIHSIIGKKCLVIGNGTIGRLAASSMVQAGASVTVTVRNYKTRQVEIPKECRVVDYKDRYTDIESYDIIISATTSPHHTIKYEECSHMLANRSHILVDLAVPEDISGKFKEMENITLYNIDSFGQGGRMGEDDKAVMCALDIIKEYKAKLESEENVREYIMTIQDISKECGRMVFERAKNKLKAEDICFDVVESAVRRATEKTVSSMLFELKKNLPPEYYSVCINAIEEVFVRGN